MAIEALHDYLTAQLPLELDAQRHFNLLKRVFLLVFASSITIHLLIGQVDSPVTLVSHATIVGLVYAIAIGLATAILYALRNTVRFLSVWHLWMVSMIGYVLGYYFLPVDGFATWLLGTGDQAHAGALGFLQLLPVWFLVTYLIVQPYLSQGLQMELVRLREINALLESGETPATRSGLSIRFEAGKTVFTLGSDKIRNIVVEDHYCYVHFLQDSTYAKRDLAMPLRDVLKLLPANFVQVHRSHVVNLDHISSITRKGRRIFVVLSGWFEVPVSRHRLKEVLPLLQQRVT